LQFTTGNARSGRVAVYIFLTAVTLASLYVAATNSIVFSAIIFSPALTVPFLQIERSVRFDLDAKQIILREQRMKNTVEKRWAFGEVTGIEAVRTPPYSPSGGWRWHLIFKAGQSTRHIHVSHRVMSGKTLPRELSELVSRLRGIVGISQRVQPTNVWSPYDDTIDI